MCVYIYIYAWLLFISHLSCSIWGFSSFILWPRLGRVVCISPSLHSILTPLEGMFHFILAAALCLSAEETALCEGTIRAKEPISCPKSSTRGIHMSLFLWCWIQLTDVKRNNLEMSFTHLALFQTEMIAHVKFAAEPDQTCCQWPVLSRAVRLFFPLSLSVPKLS